MYLAKVLGVYLRIQLQKGFTILYCQLCNNDNSSKYITMLPNIMTKTIEQTRPLFEASVRSFMVLADP
jgi:hypothetical protein